MKNLTGILIAAALVSACGGTTTTDELAQGTPDVEGLTLEMTGSTDELSREAGNEELDAQAQHLGVGPEYLGRTREAIQALNQAVRKLVEPIVALARTEGTAGQGGVKTFGPKDVGGATFLLSVKKAGINHFWKLEAKTIGAADSTYQAVAIGKLKRGEVAHRGGGVIGMDLDKLGAIDSTFKGRGKLFNTFKHAGGAKMLAYHLVGFTPDPAVREPLTATFYGHKSASGEARVRVAGLFNVLAATTAKELMLSRAVFKPGVGGRADILLPAVQRGGGANGDVPAGRFIVGHACWDTQEQEGFKLVLSCEAGKPPSTTTCTVLEQAGTRANCKPGVETDNDAPSDLDDGSTEQGAPGSFDDEAPSAMPGF